MESQKVKKGDTVETTIRDVAFGGDGVGLVNDLVIFVPFAVDGDRIRVELAGLKKKFARGEIKEILEPSPQRTAPVCPYFARCGGCRYQHIRYPHQLELKERQVREAFARIGKFPVPPLAPAKPSAAIYNYRGKAEYHINCGGENTIAIGFVHVSGSGVVDIRECMIVDDSINRACEAFRNALRAGEEKLRGRRLTLWSDAAEGGAISDLSSSSSVTRFVGSRSFLVPSRGFFQANCSMVETLAAEVIDLCALTGRETVLDCYCGSGLFALFALPRARRVFGIEGDRNAVRCAAINMGEEGKSKAKFFPGDAARVMGTEFVKGRMAVDVVILDPPRTGCSRKVLDALVALKPERVVYVSCNPATQARDCRYLAERGFLLKRLLPIDMFPQTGHIEVVGLLERREE
ncbi:MAG: class I SAM-dependent RNA methyltransferase [Deltaproteobacteria bacterium]|nr:class I SAM-dependent RNA methyltransferase [Deltaproteobacteria bacterium]